MRPLRSRVPVLVSVIVLLLAGACSSPHHQAVLPVPAPRIMIVGDSISQGSSGDYTWRYRLYEYLRSEHVEPTYVGPYTDLYDNVSRRRDFSDHTYADPDFDQHHDAIWGRSLAEAKDTIESEVAKGKPDYLLVLIGINDLNAGAGAADTTANLKALIVNARAADPHLRFVLGQLLPNVRSQLDSNFGAIEADYNRRMVQTATSESTSGSPIAIAYDDHDIYADSDLYDGTHPNAEGEVKIAAGFADTLAHSFGIGAPYPRPYPLVPLGPRTPPRLTIVPGSAKLSLTWTSSPGATYYAVDWRVAGSGGTFLTLPDVLPATMSSWTGAFPAGRTYEVKLETYKDAVQPVRFRNPGVFSNTVLVSVGN